VSRGGRADLAGLSLQLVKAPTLLIVGGRDHEVLELNRYAKKHLLCRSDMQIVSGATHLFEEPGTLSEVAKLASQWFHKYLGSSQIVSHRSA
jgi:putative phosphoribosyl transferase